MGTIKVTLSHTDEKDADGFLAKGQRPIRLTKTLKVPKPIYKTDLDALDWLKLACANDYKISKQGLLKQEPHRAILTAPHYDKANKQTVSADGFRLHLVTRKVADLPKPVGDIGKQSFPDYLRIIPEPRDTDAVGTFDRDSMIHALTALKPFAESAMNTVRVSLNGSCKLTALSAEIGDSTVEILPIEDDGYGKTREAYSHTGPNIFTAINLPLVLDALAGMPTTVTYRIAPLGDYCNKAPILLSGKVGGETRIAIIMPMHIQE